MSQELKPCPFCGSRNLKLRTEDWTCRNCGATSYWAYNTRPIEDELNAKIVQLTAERDAWKINANTMASDNVELAKIAKKRTAERDEWRADAERLAKYFIWVDGEYGIYTCIHCDTEGEYTGGLYQDILEEQVVITHSDTCPITLHRELVEKYGGENNQADVCSGGENNGS